MMDDEYSTADTGKQVVAYRNGDYTRCSNVSIRQNMSFVELQRALAHRFDVSDPTSIRIFNSQGIELYKEDLIFIKKDDVIYVSRGEDFDRASSLAEYTILKKLGEGGFGSVELGRHKRTQDLVAIKSVMNPDANASMAFTEAETMKSLGHKNIVRLYDCIPSKNMKMIFIMEYLEGGELFDVVNDRGRLPEDEAKGYFRQIAEAMQYCHDKRIIHRDLKLENVLLVKQGSPEVKVVDFGIAGLGSPMSSAKNNTGTLKYLSPEVINNQAKVAHAAQDVWSVSYTHLTLPTIYSV
eukprot:TRINITY_DN2552_c0_g3_i2.p1 TRINITY_DN2552_c0_g3~~TRINITY_DN2552_c0_g3_i2.p1  ORF type:complete len:295 (-),score=72.90 TRINITY_DN2552_c0_g3_i2:51-935(-)